MNLHVYGNGFNDQIALINKFPQENESCRVLKINARKGGIWNFVRECNELNLKVLIYNSYPESSATILINNQNGKRTSLITELNSKISNNFKKESEKNWIHIMYLDLLDVSLEDLKKVSKTNIISIDLAKCYYTVKEKKDLLRKFKYVDLIFMSEVEYEYFKNEILPRTIVHSPEKCQIIEDYFITPIKNKYFKKKVKNTLGAGDVFAAAFIYNQIKYPGNLTGDLKKSIDFANKHCSQYVMKDIFENE